MEKNNKNNEIHEKRLKIIKYIQKYIKSNNLEENSPLPSENTLSKMFEVNRNVVRSALNHLKSQGYIYSVKGKGIFVSKKTMAVVFQHYNNVGFSEVLGKVDDSYRSELLKWTKGIAGPHERKMLNLNQHEEVYRVKILRYIEGLPLAVCYSILPAKLVPDLEKHLDGFRSINEILMNIYKYPHPICDSIDIEATFASIDELKLLDIGDNIPILKQVSVFSIGDTVIEYFIVRARGDRFKFNMNFKNS